MSEDWNFYFCNVNNVLASIFLDLGLRKIVPDRTRPHLLWVWVYLRWPRDDGLSAASEFDSLKAIEEGLAETMTARFDAVPCGRITTSGRREFYYYGSSSEPLKAAVEGAMSQFQNYEFDCGSKRDTEWKHYLEVMYPSDEDRQRIENRKVVEMLENKGDTLKKPRDVWHWIYFRSEGDREKFRDAVRPLEYRVQSMSHNEKSDFPFGLCIVRFQSVKPTDLDNTVIELLRLAKSHNGDYDGWETEVITNPS
jgi:regulator of RNase E activity RraB